MFNTIKSILQFFDTTIPSEQLVIEDSGCFCCNFINEVEYGNWKLSDKFIDYSYFLSKDRRIQIDNLRETIHWGISRFPHEFRYDSCPEHSNAILSLHHKQFHRSFDKFALNNVTLKPLVVDTVSARRKAAGIPEKNHTPNINLQISGCILDCTVASVIRRYKALEIDLDDFYFRGPIEVVDHFNDIILLEKEAGPSVDHYRMLKSIKKTI